MPCHCCCRLPKGFQLIPRLILHEDDAKALCEVRGNDNQAETETARTDDTLMESVAGLSLRDACSTQQEYIDVEDPSFQSNGDLNASSISSIGQNSIEHNVPDDEANRRSKKAKQIVIKAAKTTGKVAKKTESVAQKTAKLPHLAGNHWSHNVFIVCALAIASLILSMISPSIKLASVNAGLPSNRMFLYGAHTLVEHNVLLPFLTTYHYAIPDADISFSSRVWAFILGLVAGKAFLAIIAEAWWSTDVQPIFPVPFSFIATMFVSVPASLGVLAFNTRTIREKYNPNNYRKILKKCILCVCLLFFYMVTLLASCCWAALFRRTTSPYLQPLMVVGLNVIEFVFKIVIAANFSTRLNARKWIQLNLVVDLICSNVQTAMLPYFVNPYSVAASIFFTMMTIAWRVYAGVDRCQTFCTDVRTIFRTTDSAGPNSTVKEIGRLAAKKVISPVKDNIPMSATMIGNGAKGTYPEWEDESGDELSVIELQETEESRTRTARDDSPGAAPEESPSDRREALRNDSKGYVRNSRLNEITEEQRHLFHIVDSVSSAVMVSMVRATTLVMTAVVRYFPIKDHVNKSFQLTDEQFYAAMGYGFAYIIGVVAVLLGVGVYLRRGADLGGLTINRIISYTFRDSFWFFFVWICFGQSLLYAMQIDHFGSDFSLGFVWLTCRKPGAMAWPGCVSPSLSPSLSPSS